MRLLRAVCHSNFFVRHQLKYSLLIGLDIWVVLFIVLFRKHFHNFVTFVTYLAYALVSSVANISLLLDGRGLSLPVVELTKVLEISILTMLGITFLKVILSLASSIREVCVEWIKIHPEGTEAGQKDSRNELDEVQNGELDKHEGAS